MTNIIKTFMPVKRIIKEENVENSKRLIGNLQRQPFVSTEKLTLVKKGGYLLLDFGCEFQGGIAIVVQKAQHEGTKARITFGESVMEALSSIGEKNATNNHAIRDMVVEVASFSKQRLGNTGFRFVKIQALECDICFFSIHGEHEHRDLEYKGSFQCDDSGLNKIWQVGAYTVSECMQEYLWDGIKRDRLVWMGDIHPEVSTIEAVFGYDEVVPKSLDFVRDITDVKHWMNDIPSYSMWWIIIQRDWFYHTGSIDYLKEQREYLEALVLNVLSLINDDGTNKIDFKFVDWSSNDTPASEAGLHAVIMLCLKAAVDILSVFKNDSLIDMCQTALKKLRKYTPEYKTNKQIAALMSLTGAYDIKKINDEILAPGGAKGLSTFMGFYTLKAMLNSGNVEGALNVAKEYWGKMLDLGATTFWEDFDMEWAKNATPIDEIVPAGKSDIHGDFGRFCYENYRLSLCHGWASGVTAFLSKDISGIKILKPGFQEISINPQMGNLKLINTSYPTPWGNIEIECEKINGTLKKSVKAPKDIKIIGE